MVSRLAVLFAALLLPLGGASTKDPPLLALVDGGLNEPSQLVAVEPGTGAVVARGPRLPGWAFGFEHAWSPDRSRLAILPRQADAAHTLFLIDARRLRIVARVDLGYPACALAWPSRRTLIAIVAPPPCYSTEGDLQALVVDPARRRVVSRRRSSPQAWIAGEQATASGLALLLEPPGGGAPRLVLASATSVRTIRLPSIRARGTALAVDREGRRAFVVEPGWAITEVDLVRGDVRRHRIRASTRTPASVRKGIVGAVSTAAWAGEGVLAVAGGVARRDGSFEAAGAWLVDTTNWRARRIDASAGSVAAGGGLVVTFEGSYKERGNLLRGKGASVFTRAGALRCHALAGQRVEHIRLAGGFAYTITGGGIGYAFELRRCRYTSFLIDGGIVWTLFI